MDENAPPVLVYIESAADKNIGGFTIPLPIERDVLAQWLLPIKADSDDHKSIAIRNIKIEVDGAVILDFCPDADDGLALNELNYLAVKINSFNGDEYMSHIFLSAIEAQQCEEGISGLINLIENLNTFDLQPIFSEEDYGEFSIEYGGDECADAFKRLQESTDKQDRDLAAYIEKLERHVDYSSYGRDVLKRENGVFTDRGLLLGGDNFKDIYRDHGDIPKEHLLFPEEAPRQKVVDVDVPSFLLELHAVLGDYLHDAQSNLEALAGLRSSNYLLLMDGRNAFLTNAALAYMQESSFYNIWMNAVDAPDTRAFVISLSDVHGAISGNVSHVDLAKQQDDILKHSIKPIKINATDKDGEAVVYDIGEWNLLDQSMIDEMQEYTREFATGDYNVLFRHIDSHFAESEGSAKAISKANFLARLNKPYMDKADYPADTLLRICESAAREMLARGDADIYRLLPQGQHKLTPTDAIKNENWLSAYKGFGIRYEDMPGLDKWARRGADALINRTAERTEPKKPHEPEL
jgi:hypothetical protein